MSEGRRWALILHGGAKTIPLGQHAAHRRGCLSALNPGIEILALGGSALEAAEAVVRALEDDGAFNAGYGSVLNADGQIECDAAVMEGAGLMAGGVAAVSRIRNPISTAVAMLPDAAVLVVGEGAHRFAEEKSQVMCRPEDLMASSSHEATGCDTVGCVALDDQGLIIAATSTGGLSGSRAGRVGDAPIPGCGLYADNAVGGVAFSGDGESIIRLALAGRLMTTLETQSPDAAIADALARLERVGGEAGAIVIDVAGRIGWGHSSDHFAVAFAASDLAPQAHLDRQHAPGGNL